VDAPEDHGKVARCCSSRQSTPGAGLQAPRRRPLSSKSAASSPAQRRKPATTLVIACGALVRELGDIVAVNELDFVTIECLPAKLHNTPEAITEVVADRIERARGRFQRLFVGYADCGTGGELDRLLAKEGIERLPGASCYEFFATIPVLDMIHDSEPGTFYLTDYLARYFDLFVIRGLGLDRHPDLRDTYFGNFRRVMHLAQLDDLALEQAGREAARRLDLDYERILVGYGDLESTMVGLRSSP
jgi:hypothetical protein